MASKKLLLKAHTKLKAIPNRDALPSSEVMAKIEADKLRVLNLRTSV